MTVGPVTVGPSIAVVDPPSPGVRARIPITFLGMAGLGQDVVLEQFVRNPQVIDAVADVNAAPDEAARNAAVNRLMEGLG